MGMSAAVASAPTSVLPASRQAQPIESLLEPATRAWHSTDLAQAAAASDVLAATVVAAADPATDQQSSLAKLKDMRTLVQTFVGVVSKTSAAANLAATASKDIKASTNCSESNHKDKDCDMETDVNGSSDSDCELVARLVQAWAPGVFAVALRLAGWTQIAASAPDGKLAAVLAMPSTTEHVAMLGRKLDESDQAPAEEGEGLQLIRAIIYE